MENRELLVNPNIIAKAQEIIINLTPEEKALSYLIIDKEFDKIKQELRKNLFSGSLNTIEFTFNDQRKQLKIIRGVETEKEVITKDINYEKAINFAKEHNFVVPMTERVVIEPEIDISKLESQDWFQNNVTEFVLTKVEKKITKSNDTIRITDLKEVK